LAWHPPGYQSNFKQMFADWFQPGERLFEATRPQAKNQTGPVDDQG
jgi:hypothetical protein